MPVCMSWFADGECVRLTWRVPDVGGTNKAAAAIVATAWHKEGGRNKFRVSKVHFCTATPCSPEVTARDACCQ